MIISVDVLLIEASKKLKKSGNDENLRDAKKILAFVLNCDYQELNRLSYCDVSGEKIDFLNSLIRDRVNKKPISKILGRRMFYKGDFIINEEVLDPRPETEGVVSIGLKEKFGTVLDLGVGSGCILISLLKDNLISTGLGVDISMACLEASSLNAVRSDVSNRARFVLSNWFENINEKFDLIVSNPPYISETEFENLDDDVKCYDPKVALISGKDGLDAYRVIVKEASKYLNDKGRVVLEIGCSQSDAVKELFLLNGFADVRTWKDINGKDRIVSARLRT
jgi:release factor glutamine methyltransferase